MTATVAKARLTALVTADLIAQYDQAISSHAGRHTEHGPRQNRINHIVDLLADRADDGDPAALAWLDH